MADMDEAGAAAAAPPAAGAGKGEGERAIVLRTVHARLDGARTRARRNRIGAMSCLSAAVIFALVGVLVGVDDLRNKAPDWTSGILGGLVLAAILAAVGIGLHTRQREAEAELRELEIEVDLLSFPIPPRQVRAERLFRRNEYELLKYYTLNLRQSRAILGVGVGCIAAGLGVVGLTFYAVMSGPAAGNPDSAVWTQAIVGVVGAVSAVLVNFVAAVYLKMHGENATALSGFHERLVGSNNLFLANMLVSRIDSEADREKTLAEMALTLSKK